MILRPLQMVGLFLIQLFVCEIPFLSGMKRRQRFPGRMILTLLLFLGSVVGLTWVRSLLPGNESYVLSQLKGIAYFLGIILLNAIAVWGCFDTELSGALFAVIGGYSIEHAASRFSYLIQTWAYHQQAMPPFVELFVFDFAIPVIFSLVFFFTLILKGIVRKTMPYHDRKILAVSALNLVICIVLSAFEPRIGNDWVVDSLKMQLALSGNYICAILACTLCLLLQAGYFKESELDTKNRMLAEMLELERQKQTLSKETIDIINRKCHDLRHQIRMLEQQSPEDRTRSLEKITEALRIYDSLLKTGNSTVDLVFMEKKLFCEKNAIAFTYLVDGEKIQFMDEADIYAMLGNMLDNAIESVSREEDPEKRVITFTASARGDMLYLCMENYCSATISFQDGFPETSKSDKAFHGFGTQSIAHIAQKYGGSVRFFQENQYFIAEVLIPMPVQP